MKRREFIRDVAGKGQMESLLETKIPSKDIIQADLDELSGTLDRKKALHLLRRVTFAPSPELINQIIGKTASEALNLILGGINETLPEPPNRPWVNTPHEDPLKAGNPALRFQIEAEVKAAYKEFVDWWTELMRTDTVMPLKEKLTLFWSTLWCIEFTYDTLALNPPGLLLRNNQTLRKMRLGNYADFAEAITLDGSMLLYQSLFYSNRKIANENFMRELMELFMMGTGDIITGEKNYLESDVREGTKALTGWRTGAYLNEPAPKEYFNTYFSPDDHIIEAKSFLNNIIQSRDEDRNTEDLVKKDEVRGIIDIIFKEKKNAVARFISDKIYRYFVYSNPKAKNADLINNLANHFITSEYNLKPLFIKLLASQHFFDDSNIGVQFKTPPDLIIGLMRMLDVKYAEASSAISNLEQTLYDPPNVGSWKGYRTWLSTKTFPLRIKYSLDIINAASKQSLFKLAKSLPNPTSLENVNNNLIEFFLPNYSIIDNARKDFYKEILLNGIDQSLWLEKFNAEDDAAERGIRNVIMAFVKAPDFQLC